MEQYRNELNRLCVDKAGKEALVQWLMENKKAPRRTQRELPVFRPALIAAAVAALTVTAALAISPMLRDVLQNALGGFAPYAQDMTGDEVSCTDQGVRVSVVSALNDGNAIAIYFEVQDLIGDRLDEFTKTNMQITWPEHQVEWKQGTLFPTEQIAYDEETKTALYCTKFVGDGVPAQSLTIPLHGQGFSPGFHSFDQHQPLPGEVISETVLQTEKLPDGSVVLVPRQNPTGLLDGCLTMSSCGFGDDGRFHIQLSAKTGTITALRPSVHSREFLSGQKKDGLTNGYPMDHKARFDRDGMTYYDFSYQAAREEIDDIVIDQLIAIVQEEEEIEGEWRLDVPLETQNPTAVSMEQSGTELAIGPKAVCLFLSPISCTIESDPQDGKGALGYLLTLFHADGSVTSGVKCDSTYFSGSYATNHWTFPNPIDPNTVTAIAIGSWYVPIEDGIARPGRWLAEAPQ